tara:strand:+ start:219 stop:461 length:243 start_codon:yes stop_codon:yes gene_type:complete
MIARKQLNINIDANLLKKIKQKAVESDMNIGDYVNSILKCYLTNKDLDNNNAINHKRINRIEEQLKLINKNLNNFKTNKN